MKFTIKILDSGKAKPSSTLEAKILLDPVNARKTRSPSQTPPSRKS